MTSLGSVDGYVDHVRLNFNAGGEVSGWGYSAQSAFFASAEAGMVTFKGLVEDTAYLEITAMKDAGVIIGCSLAPESVSHAVLWGDVPDSPRRRRCRPLTSRM